MKLALVLFDIDGTVFDSEGAIIDGFRETFDALGFPPPVDCAITRTIGLSLELAVGQMAQNRNADEQAQIVETYREISKRRFQDVAFYPGMRALLGALTQYDHLFLGAATGKRRAGLDPLLERTGLSQAMYFRQTPDLYPSKPHPAMIEAAVEQLGFDKSRVVMIGDTSFDIDMAHAAGVRSIGVNWGYHGEELIAAKPDVLVDKPEQIFDQLREWQLI